MSRKAIQNSRHMVSAVTHFNQLHAMMMMINDQLSSACSAKSQVLGNSLSTPAPGGEACGPFQGLSSGVLGRTWASSEFTVVWVFR